MLHDESTNLYVKLEEYSLNMYIAYHNITTEDTQTMLSFLPKEFQYILKQQ